MIRRTISLVMAALAFMGVSGATLSPEAALGRVRGSSRVPIKFRGRIPEKLLYTAEADNGLPAVYVFGNENGYMLLGADDVARPILGYSDTGRFDFSSLPPQMKWWLEEYSRQIAAASEANLPTYAPQDSEREDDFEPIAPLLKSKWNQDAPYNEDTPVFGGKSCMTGCVATSMAQVMNYFHYPAIAAGTVTYTTGTYKKELSIDFSEQPFDWNNMQDTYAPGSHDNGAAVAWLMKCCGYSVEMDYTPEESSAMSYKIAPALINYFQYDKGLYYTYRNLWSTEDWEHLIYDNLKNVGPVIYNGTSSLVGGHSFVCDGYAGNGFFHINWGWGGTSDGYFVFDTLNPGTLGIGGGYGGFNFSQAAVLGVRPPVAGSELHPCNLTQQGTLEAEYKNDLLIFSLSGTKPTYWMNKGAEDFRFSMGAQFEPQDGTDGNSFTNICYLVGSNTSGSLAPNYFYNDLRPSAPVEGMKDGRYKVTIVTRDNSVKNAPWIPVLCDYRFNNYVYVTKKGSEYSIETPATRTLQLRSVSLDSDLYYGCMAKISITLENETDVELTQGYAPLFQYNGRTSMIGESVVVTVGPGETKTVPIYTSLYAASSTLPPNNSKVVIRLYDPSSGVEAIYREPNTEAIIKNNPGAPTMSLVSMHVDEEKDEEDIYELEIGQTLDFESEFKVLRGYFAYPLYALIKNQEDEVLVQKRIDRDQMFLKAGQTANVEVGIDYPQAELGMLYTCNLAYMMDYQLKNIGTGFEFRYKQPSGINGLLDDASGLDIRYDGKTGTIYSDTAVRLELFDLTGRKLASSEAGVINILGLGAGSYIVVAYDAGGNMTSLKIRR